MTACLTRGTEPEEGGIPVLILARSTDCQTLKDFFGSVWEEKPRVFSNQFTTGFFPGKFSFESLLELTDSLASEGDALDFGLDINAARYRDGIRETPNRKASGHTPTWCAFAQKR